MAQTYADAGIVIRRVAYGEADRILTLLTKESGKIGVIARGARRTKSKLGAVTDLYVEGDFQFVKSRGDLDLVTQGTMQHSLPQGRSYAELLSAAVIAETTDKLVVDHAPDASTYAHCEFAMSMLWESYPMPMAVAGWYPIALCTHLGYAPVVDRCMHCSRELPEEPSVYVANLNGFCCAHCRLGYPSGIPTDVRALKVIRLAIRSQPSLFFRLKFDLGVCVTMLAISDALVTEHSGRNLKAMSQMLSYVGEHE